MSFYGEIYFCNQALSRQSRARDKARHVSYDMYTWKLRRTFFLIRNTIFGELEGERMKRDLLMDHSV